VLLLLDGERRRRKHGGPRIELLLRLVRELLLLRVRLLRLLLRLMLLLRFAVDGEGILIVRRILLHRRMGVGGLGVDIRLGTHPFMLDEN